MFSDMTGVFSRDMFHVKRRHPSRDWCSTWNHTL